MVQMETDTDSESFFGLVTARIRTRLSSRRVYFETFISRKCGYHFQRVQSQLVFDRVSTR